MPAPQMRLPSGSTPCAGVAFPAVLSCGLPGGRFPHENCPVKPVACVKQLAGSASAWKGGYEQCLLCDVQTFREVLKLLGIQLMCWQSCEHVLTLDCQHWGSADYAFAASSLCPFLEHPQDHACQMLFCITCVLASSFVFV